jgi:hypothetical protein
MTSPRASNIRLLAAGVAAIAVVGTLIWTGMQIRTLRRLQAEQAQTLQKLPATPAAPADWAEQLAALREENRRSLERLKVQVAEGTGIDLPSSAGEAATAPSVAEAPAGPPAHTMPDPGRARREAELRQLRRQARMLAARTAALSAAAGPPAKTRRQARIEVRPLVDSRRWAAATAPGCAASITLSPASRAGDSGMYVVSTRQYHCPPTRLR